MRDITIEGAHEHDLDVDLTLPGGRWTAVVGVSGSGKTSLVFDTLVREGRRRFLQTRSARARRQLGKLGAADVERLDGLPVPLAVGAGRLTRSDRSTVGTLSGLLDLLRLLYARDGSDGPHTRSDFSFNSTGACPDCAGLGRTEDIAIDRIVVAPDRSIRDGALGPTLPSGYTVYSQVTLDVMDTLCQAHGFTVDTPWNALDDAQRHMVLYGTRALQVPFGKHSLESRLKWEGITARPREVGYYRGLVPVMQETLRRSRNKNILRYAHSVPCGGCGGSRLGPVGRTTTVAGRSLPERCELRLDGLVASLKDVRSAVWDATRDDFERRVGTAVELGLGHLTLARPSTTLSDGELQRLRLVSQLGVALSGMLLALDEPTLGLHPSSHPGLEQALRAMQAQGNTVLTVEHDPHFVTAADQLVVLGPGAGREGGRVVFHGPMPEAPLGRVEASSRRRAGDGDLLVRGAHLYGLDTDLVLRRGALNIVCGPSGAGKSSLVFGTLLPALEGRPSPCASVEGATGLQVRSVDARPLGRTPRSTPATATGLFDRVRTFFASLPGAKSAKLTASHFSHNHRAGRCPACEGLGVERIGLHLMRDVERPCTACGGGRYQPDVLTVRFAGHTIADVLTCPVDDARALFAEHPRIHAMLDALSELGLGYLPLGRSTTAISRGEAQRIKLASLLGRPEARPCAVLLDEPDRGLHPHDLARLIRGLQALVDQGHTVVAISHSPALWACADHLVEVVEGRARARDTPPVIPPRPPGPHPPVGLPDAITLRGVRTHNLTGIDVRFPHGAMSVVCGVSGSGKSSLVFHTLAAEAERRFAESLPFEVRRHLRKVRRPSLAHATGLTPTLSLKQRGSVPRGRSTVATRAGLGADLRLLYSREGLLDGAAHGLPAEAFTPTRPLGRCPECEGHGTVRRCTEERLVTHPEKSLLDGALSGTRPGRFFSEATGRHLALLEAVGGRALLETPWAALSPAQRALALQGSPEVLEVVWRFQRGKRTGEHVLSEPWQGFVRYVTDEAIKRANRKDAAQWWAPFEQRACPSCEGSGLAPGPRSVSWAGHTLPALAAHSVDQVRAILQDTPTTLPRLTERIHEVLDGLSALSLGHLPLDRRSDALSAGEVQRLGLAEVLGTGLSGLTLALDEPASGLDEAGITRLLQTLRQLVDQGNTLVVVSHREALLRAADHLVELGPGAGDAGGCVVARGPAVLAGDGPTAQALREDGPEHVGSPLGPDRIDVRGARRPGRAPIDLALPTSGVVALTGPSGAGKSWLMREVLAPSARERHAVGCAEVHGLDRFVTVVEPLPSSAETVGFALGWMKPIQRTFAKGTGMPARAFSFRSPAGRCPTCKGRGVERVALDVLADLTLPCPACSGSRYAASVLEARVDGQSIADVLGQPLSALVLPGLDLPLASRLGIGHLTLSTPLSDLSGGERQRVTLCRALSERASPRLVLLDEPDRGLHPQDLRRLVPVLRGMAAHGDLVVLATQRRALQEAADRILVLQ